MAFEVEDGNGNSDANSYSSVPAADEYHADRNNVEWSKLDQAQKEGALIAATDWISSNYAGLWKGNRAFANQGLDFPRVGFVNPATGNQYPLGWMPRELIFATAQLALEAAQGKLYNNASPQTPQLIERTVGPITRKFAAVAPGAATMQRSFPWIDRMLSTLTQAGGGMRLSVVRA